MFSLGRCQSTSGLFSFLEAARSDFEAKAPFENSKKCCEEPVLRKRKSVICCSARPSGSTPATCKHSQGEPHRR